MDHTEDTKEIETLRNHNAELLADLKKARSKVTGLTEQLEAATMDKDAALAECQRIKFNEPVNKMMQSITDLPEYFQMEFNALGYRFDLDGERIVIRDQDGNPAMVKCGPEPTNGEPRRTREAEFAEDDIRHLAMGYELPEEKRAAQESKVSKLLPKAIGTGARGAPDGSGLPAGSARSPARTAPDRLSTGLR